MRNTMVDRFGRLIAATFALAGFAGLADAKAIPPEAAPAEWVDYARQATGTITAWLNAGDPNATAFRAMIDGNADAPDVALIVRIWVDRNGALTRVEGGAAIDPAVMSGLNTFLVGRRLAAPPRHMRLPMRIALGLRRSPPPSSI